MCVCVCACACVCMYACGHIRVTSPATATILKSVTKWSNGTTVGHVNDNVTRDRWICAIHRLRCAIDGSIDCAPIGRLRTYRSIAQSSIDRALKRLRNRWMEYVHVLWCETLSTSVAKALLQASRIIHYTIASC